VNETKTTVSGILAELQEKPFFRVVKAIPDGLSSQIEAAVFDFMKTSHVPKGIDQSGFYQQTLAAIANCTYMGGGGDFWVGVKDGKLTTYVLAHVSKDIDHRMSYNVSQAWVERSYRGRPIVKEWYEQMRQRAKDLFCGHLVITSSRNAKAYKRFLGHGMDDYAILLKETF
jgi:hypothetical protein